jgi:hypothetical protein
LDLDSPELTALPSALHALLAAELAAGNRIAELDRGFPAPPVGLCVILEKPVSTRSADAQDGLHFREWPNWKGYNGYADAREFYFVLNPPRAPPSDPVMRWEEEGAALSLPAAAEVRQAVSESPGIGGNTLLRRFEKSMHIDYEKWHDGIGYDLDALTIMDRDERSSVEGILLARGVADWRDVEALAWLNTTTCRMALRRALEEGDAIIRLAVVRHAPDLATPEIRTASLVSALETVTAFAGLSQTLDEAARFHPPEVMAALWRGVSEREGDVAVHFAALLTYLHGKAGSIFDFEQRPFFLTFNTPEKDQRMVAVMALRKRLGVAEP